MYIYIYLLDVVCSCVNKKQEMKTDIVFTFFFIFLKVYSVVFSACPCSSKTNLNVSRNIKKMKNQINKMKT